jgi:hypothetical protein
MALHTGAEPLFFLGSTSFELFMPYPDQTLPFIPKMSSTVDLRHNSKGFLNNIDNNLSTA